MTTCLPRVLVPAALVLAAALFAGCSVKTTVSVGASTPAQVQHLYITVTGVWLNTRATASPEDTDWVGTSLATPVIVDLSALGSGTLASLVNGVNTGAGTYKQVRLVLADSADPLTTAAQAAGLNWNAQIQVIDAAGQSKILALELPSPNSQLIIGASLILSGGASRVFTNAATSTSEGTTDPAAAIAIDIDAVRNWVLFSYGDQTGALLNPSMRAANLKHAGAISGSVDLSGIASDVLSGPQGIVVTAEALSADGSRFEALKSVALQSGGDFTLYPLPVADSGTSNYELVIHGPGIRTLIISQVPVSAGDAASATRVQSAAIAVSAARKFTVNTAANSPALPGGASVGFYQTIPGTTAPHLIEYAALDPFSGGFAANLALSADAIDHAGYDNGSALSIGTSAADEGLGTYRVGSIAPLRTPSSLATIIAAPSTPLDAVQPVFPPPLNALGSASVGGTINFSQPGRFDRGYLLISRGGQLLDALDLSASLSGANSSARFADSGLPAGLGDAVDVSVRLWNSRDPAGTITREAAASRVDPGAAGAQTLTLFVP